MPDDDGARWATVAEQRHVIIEKRRDADGRGYVLTACGWLVWPSRHDARMVDAKTCIQCDVLQMGRGAEDGRLQAVTNDLTTHQPANFGGLSASDDR